MVRYVLGGLLGIAVLVVLFGARGDLVAARHEFGHLAAGWLRGGYRVSDPAEGQRDGAPETLICRPVLPCCAVPGPVPFRI